MSLDFREEVQAGGTSLQSSVFTVMRLDHPGSACRRRGCPKPRPGPLQGSQVWDIGRSQQRRLRRSRQRGQKKTGRLLRGTRRMLLNRQRVTSYIKYTDGSSNRRSKGTGFNNREATVNLSKGRLNAEKGSKV